MAVQKVKKVDGNHENVGDLEYVGCVLSTGSRVIRVMSDVWSDEHYAVVWTGTDTKSVTLSVAEFGTSAHATVDATPEVVAAYEVWKAEQDRLSQEAAERAYQAQREEEAREACLSFDKGDRVKVFKGRKVAKGTTGVVIWKGHGDWGLRVGIKDDAGTVHWTARDNVCKVTDKPEGMSWVDYLNKQEEDEAEREAACPKKGEYVLILTGPEADKSGIVFWERNGRLGVATSDRKDASGKNADVAWVNAADCRHLTEAEVAEAKAKEATVLSQDASDDDEVVVPF